MDESFIVRLSREDTYHHLFSLCQNDDLFTISDYRQDMREGDLERIVISDSKLVEKLKSARGAVIGTIRLLPNDTKTTVMIVYKDAFWNESISDGGKRLFSKFIKRAKEHFISLDLLEEISTMPSSKRTKSKSSDKSKDLAKDGSSSTPQSKTSDKQVTIAIIGAMAIVFAACISLIGNVIDALGPKAVDVASTAIVATSTITPSPTCPPEPLLSIPATPSPPIFIIVLLDTTSENLDRAKDLIVRLPTVLRSGDEIIVLKTGDKGFQNALVFQEKLDMGNTFNIYERPTPYPTVTAINTVTPFPPGFEAVVATKTALAYQASIRATEQYNLYLYNCALQQYNNIGLTATQEATKLDVAIEIFSQDLQDKVSNVAVSTPIPNQFFEGLTFSSRVLSQECDNYSKCFLIIVSDLGDLQFEVPNNEILSFEKADVLSFMLNCFDTLDPICKQRADYWSQTYYSLQAKNVFFFGSFKAENNLLGILKAR